MIRRRFDLLIFIGVVILAVIFFISNSSFIKNDSDLSTYSKALELYKNTDYETAYQEFGKVSTNSSIKQAARFRQARCATNLNRKEVAIKKYNQIVKHGSKTAIAPISEYNMAILLYETENYAKSKKIFLRIIDKYPKSDYAIAANYYLGLLTMEKIKSSNGNKINKYKEKTLEYFKTYLQLSPDGRFAIRSINNIQKLNIQLGPYDNYLIAKSLYLNGEYDNAKKYFEKTKVEDCWIDIALNEYRLGNREKGFYYLDLGIKEYIQTIEQAKFIELTDLFITNSPKRKEGIEKLYSYNIKENGGDYINYLYCSEVTSDKETCYKNLFEKFPNGQFSADALYSVFMSKYLAKKYNDAQRLGMIHIKKYSNAKSSPAILYFMGKIAQKQKHYDTSDNYFKTVLKKYPDNYYAYRANYNLNKEDGNFPFLEISSKPIVFPYKKSLDNNLVIKLALLKDYDLVEELCKKDKFIQSWLAYKRGNITISTVLARNMMDEMEVKPDFSDFRWRLVYPTHYYDIVDKVKGDNNPIILEAIIKEESHFNENARSSAGAIGLMQLMPSTYSEVIGKNNISGKYDEKIKNITAGSYYYSSLKRILGNKDVYAISAYNGGIGSVTGWLSKQDYADFDEFVEQIPYPETKNYVKKVLRTYWMYGNLY